jgi:hypothetical protein
MCQFFSLVSNAKGNIYYFDAEVRKKIITRELNYQTDSHSSIADYYEINEDKFNKYEFNPLTKKFTIDQLNTKDDSAKVNKFCEQLDFKTIAPELIIKLIVNPLKLDFPVVTEKEIKLLKEWASVRDSIRASVRALVRDSVRDSVGNSVRDSVGDSVWAYTSSYFDLKKWKYVNHEPGVNPYQSCIKLWESSLAPSFDGKTWRLHTGEKAKIVFEISKEDLIKF